MASPQLTFAEKRKQWIEILVGDDRHAIAKQLTQMTWDAARYQIVNESRRLLPAAPDGSLEGGALLHGLLDRSYFISAMAAIRRLADDFGFEGPRGVYSLKGLIQDMLKHRHLITREAVFLEEGLEYDLAKARRMFLDYLQQQHAAGKEPGYVPRDLRAVDSEELHRQMDQLTGVDEAHRSPGDAVSEQLLQNLVAKIDGACDTVRQHVNKFIAHSASPCTGSA